MWCCISIDRLAHTPLGRGLHPSVYQEMRVRTRSCSHTCKIMYSLTRVRAELMNRLSIMHMRQRSRFTELPISHRVYIVMRHFSQNARLLEALQLARYPSCPRTRPYQFKEHGTQSLPIHYLACAWVTVLPSLFNFLLEGAMYLEDM